MEKLYARFNYGRWIVDCPNCSAATKVNIGDEMVFCGGMKCHPDKRAKKAQLLPDKTIMFVSDKDKQDLAKAEAWSANEVYEIVFPSDAKPAEKVLRKRKTEHMNYYPDRESLEDLEEENKCHPKLDYIWDKEENKKRQEEIKPKPKKQTKLSEKQKRRIR